MTTNDQNSLGDEGTLAAVRKRRPEADVSLGDERTLGGGGGELDTRIDNSEVVDLEARYKIEGTLGQGGMGAVLLATDTRLDRKVAIKRILGEAAGNRMAVQRFLTEAKAIAALNHPNIVQIYDYGRAKDGPFLIMEYVDGGSLLERCRESALPLDEAIELSCQLCDGLAKAHDLGIIHRDIKPANVLLTKDGIPKLTDFGLAKAEANDHGMTMTGAVMGTPDFMPPEQRRDASLVDHRSDLWSLAATVYQMLTGRSPKIIRFDLLPAELTKVFGKALEDAKEARYQSAREFRDAIRTSLRTAAAVDELIEGACPACGVKNDSSRRFCRGCGESLEAPCLSCSKPMPMWEEICGSCGSKQTPLVDERRKAMVARQAEAEGLLGDFDCDRATAIATQLRDELHPKLRHFSAWATGFLEQIEKVRVEQTRQASEAIVEAAKHEAAHDYLSAAFVLDGIPEVMRTQALPGVHETAAKMLDRIKKKQREVQRLESLIKERLAAKKLDELLSVVDRFLALQPDRADVAKIRTQLLERQSRQAAIRDEALGAARESLVACDYEKSLAALANIAAASVTPEVVSLREEAESLVRKVRGLAKRIKDALSAKRMDGLLPAVEEYLALKPGDAEISRLRQSLVEREEKLSAEIASRFQQAMLFTRAAQFAKAAQLLQAVPDSRRSPEVQACLARAGKLAALQAAAVKVLSNAKPGTFGTAIDGCRHYRAGLAEAKLTDTEFASLYAKTESAHAEEQRTRKVLFITGAAAAALMGVIALVGVGVWSRSATRASAVSTAIRNSRWGEALAIEPDNPTALAGRAREKLLAWPADIEGALTDLEKAERQPGASAIVKPVRAEAYAVRAREHAHGGRLDKAAEDLRMAKAASAPAEAVSRAEAAIARGWLGRGGSAVTKGDIQGVRRAADAALAAGADAGAVGSLRARGMVLESRSLVKSDVNGAVERMLEASLLDKALVEAALGEPGFADVKAGVAGKYLGRFDQAVARGAWDEALAIAGTAEAIDPSSATWVREAVGRIPPLVNSLGMELKLIPAGTFTMGQRGGGYSDERPHGVTLSRPYYLGVTEVTNAQWKAVMGSVPSHWQEADRPVEQVTWEEAVEFCRNLSALPAERQAGRVYRLPTEAEWEYACRAGTETQWSCGDDESRLGEYAWYGENSGGETHPVGKKKPNGWGLYDMHGNVWEWCSDWYGKYPPGAVTDPQGPSGGSSRVGRGGGWRYSAWGCRSALRFRDDPSDRDLYLGFRLALSPSGGKSAGGGE